MVSSSSSLDIEKGPKKLKTLRVLALHGSGGTAESMVDTMGIWNEYLAREDEDDNVELQITAVGAHVAKDGGFAWWSLPPGVRSSTATTYDGFDRSRAAVLEALSPSSIGGSTSSSSSSSSKPPIDIVMGHSQGAILIAALLATNSIPRQLYPRLGFILNGVAWPNPYTAELEALRIITTDPSVLVIEPPLLSPPPPPPRVLVIVGERDTINAPDQAARVAAALQNAGCIVTTLSHPGGHAVPIRRDETWEAIRAWLLQQQQQS